LNLDIHVGTVGGDALVRDYVTGSSRLAPFFVGSPFDPDSYRRKAEEVRSRFDATALGAMTGAVRPISERAAQKLAAVGRGEGFFITTGQQPGLFGGPLYTVHKALSAIALASRLEEVLGTTILPLFWVASDDHDWEEANHVHLLDTANTLHRLTLAGDPQPARSMGRRLVGDGAENALGEIGQILPPSDFAPTLLASLQGAYRPENSVAGAFREVLVGLFDGLDLALVDGQDPVIRAAGAPVLLRALEHAAAGEDPLEAQTERLVAAGYEAQVAVLPGASTVFHEDAEHGRERLMRHGNAWVLRASGRRLEEDELWSLFDDHPDRFSANVTLRPVVESATFPTIAYVAGPGEVRYLAQTRAVFDAHGVGMPLVFPRLSVVLVEGKVRKVLDKFGLEPAAFRRPVHELIAAAVREDVPAPVQEALATVRDSIRTGYEALNSAAREVDPTLKGPINHGRNEAFKALAEVEKKIRQHVKAKEQTELEQIEKAAANLAPLGKPQERVLNMHQYLARYGTALVREILSRMEAEVDARLGAVPAPGAAATSPGSTAE
jgi:bacillithiol synthase